jgi:hypothetical protein
MTTQQKFGCIDKKRNGNCEMQLWLEDHPEAGEAQRYQFVVRNVDPSTRRCTLDSGARATYEQAVQDGKAAFDKQLQPTKPHPADRRAPREPARQPCRDMIPGARRSVR